MDIQKAQRLSQHVSFICDMVKYNDVGARIVAARAISAEENEVLQAKLDTNGNLMVMHELLAMLTLRRGGFDSLVIALKKSDYGWLAEQLDPGNTFLDPSDRNPATPVQNMVTAMRNRISRKSESVISSQSCEDVFMSYRDECSIDIPLNPSYYASLRNSKAEEELVTIEPNLLPTFPAKEISSNTSVRPEAESINPKTTFRLKMLHLTDANPSEKSVLTSPSKQAVIYNICPEKIKDGNVEEYFSTLVKRANVPSPLVKDIKVIRSGKISKRYKRKNKLKLQFNSEVGRNAFVENLNQFIANMKPSDDMFESVSSLRISASKKKNKVQKALFRPKKKNEMKTGQSETAPPAQEGAVVNSNNDSFAKQRAKHWFQKPFYNLQSQWKS